MPVCGKISYASFKVLISRLNRLNRTWVAETRLEKVGQSEDECEAGHDGDENVDSVNEVRTVEGEE